MRRGRRGFVRTLEDTLHTFQAVLELKSTTTMRERKPFSVYVFILETFVSFSLVSRCNVTECSVQAVD